jgi:hypothetical protein
VSGQARLGPCGGATRPVRPLKSSLFGGLRGALLVRASPLLDLRNKLPLLALNPSRCVSWGLFFTVGDNGGHMSGLIGLSGGEYLGVLKIPRRSISTPYEVFIYKENVIYF